MATQGNFFWINKALDKFAGNGPIDLEGHTFKAVLLGAGQVIGKTFVGTSTDARYADLTAEFATANGYTAAGVALTSPLITLASNVATWSTSSFGWTFTGAGLTAVKYCLIYDNTAANKDILCACDMDTGGGTINIAAGPVSFTLPSGILNWTQP